MLESLLDEIPQLGEVRRKALLDRFGSVSALRKASIEEIGQTPGIGEGTAKVISEYLASVQSHAIDMATGEINGVQ